MAHRIRWLECTKELQRLASELYERLVEKACQCSYISVTRLVFRKGVLPTSQIRLPILVALVLCLTANVASASGRWNANDAVIDVIVNETQAGPGGGDVNHGGDYESGWVTAHEFLQANEQSFITARVSRSYYWSGPGVPGTVDIMRTGGIQGARDLGPGAGGQAQSVTDIANLSGGTSDSSYADVDSDLVSGGGYGFTVSATIWAQAEIGGTANTYEYHAYTYAGLSVP